MKVEIEFDFFGELDGKVTKEQLKEWIEFTIGSKSQMESNNPMNDIDFFDDDIEVTVTVK